MEKLIEILEGLNPEVDYLTILSLVAEIEDEFEVEIPTVEIIPSNFNSAESIYALITKLQEEE